MPNGTNPQTESASPSRSNRQYVLFAIIAILIAIVVGLWLFLRSKPNPLSALFGNSTPTLVQQLLPQNQEQITGEVALAQMLQSGQSGKCTLTNKQNPQEKVQYFVDGKKIKIITSSADETQSITSYMLMDEQYSYVWQSDSNQGMKYKVLSEAEQQQMMDKYTKIAQEYEDLVPDTNEDQDELQMEAEEDYVVKCDYQSISATEFVAPTNVEFIDMSDSFSDVNSDVTLDAPISVNDMSEQELERWAKKMEQLYGEEAE